MAKIKRTDKRIAAQGVCSFFADKRQLWLQLKAGEVIEVPDSELDAIKQGFGGSIEIVVIDSKPTDLDKVLGDISDREPLNNDDEGDK